MIFKIQYLPTELQYLPTEFAIAWKKISKSKARFNRSYIRSLCRGTRIRVESAMKSKSKSIYLHCWSKKSK